MTVITLNFSNCKTWKQLHGILSKTFGLPDYYGENWDALWDCLRDRWLGCGNVTVEVIGFHSMDWELKDYCVPLLEIFEDVHEETPNAVFKIIS